jgi:hypothetical protein
MGHGGQLYLYDDCIKRTQEVILTRLNVTQNGRNLKGIRNCHLSGAATFEKMTEAGVSEIGERREKPPSAPWSRIVGMILADEHHPILIRT